MKNKLLALSTLIIMLMAFAGCGSRAALNQRHFLLEPSRNIPQQKTAKNIILDIKSFNIDRPFSAKSFVYRKSQAEYETDFYNQFLISPDDMITEKTRIWLTRSGLFKSVLEPGSYASPTHVLEGNIMALYGDFRDMANPKAAMSIRFFVIKLLDKDTVFGKTYDAQSKVESKNAESLVKAFDECLANILANLENDLNGQL